MSYPLSRLMSAATVSYGVYALAEPRHLGRFMTDNQPEQATYDLLARTYGARDLAIGALGLLGRSDRTVATAMKARIAFDLADALLLSTKATDENRSKLLGITCGYAAVNAVALMIDRRSSGRAATGGRAPRPSVRLQR
jgi:hypothetical protein